MQNDLPRFLQLSAILRWLTGETQSAYLVSPGKTALFIREGNQELGCAVLNLTMDEYETTEISVAGDMDGWLLSKNGKQPLERRFADGRTIFDLGVRNPWEVLFFVAKAR
jgi:hypothetical protein